MEKPQTNTNHDRDYEIIYEMTQGTAKRLNAKDGAFIFAACGCAVTERQTPSGIYVYTATNLNTGKTEIVSRRKRKLAVSAYSDVAKKITASSVQGEPDYSADKKPSEKSDVNELKKTSAYIFKEILPKHGYNFRERQAELADHILSVIEKRGITLAESEVGTGKTHAYLVSSVLAKRGRLNDFWLRKHGGRQSWAESAHMPVVISTSSIALQNAIVRDYIPELSRILVQSGIINKPLTAFVRKGKEHYICEERLRRYLQNTDRRAQELLKHYIGVYDPFDLTDAGELSGHIKRGVYVKDGCGDNCKLRDRCRYQNYIKEANDPRIDFQITNHNYFLADNLHRVSGRTPLLPNYQLVIVDEAHKMLAAARSMYGLELTDKELPELAARVHNYASDKSRSGIQINKLAKKMEEQSQKLFQTLEVGIPESENDDDSERLSVVIDNTVGSHLAGIAAAASDIAEASANSPVHDIHLERRAKAIRKLKQVSERVSSLCKRSKLIYWLEKRTEGEKEIKALCATRKNLEKQLFNDLWSKGVPMVLTSGTLSASGDFTRTKETLGLHRLQEHKLFHTSMASPFDFKNNALLYISENMPFPNNKDKHYINAVANEVERLVRASHGHAAVLFTSYSVMGQVHALLKQRKLPFPLFRLERGGTHGIEQFKKSGNGILLAAGALWEGIDIPGDALSMLIIVRLPFPVPDPISEYEWELCGDMEVYKLRAIIPDMLVKLKQGSGRAHRNETDTAVIAIIDCRASERGAYRNIVLKALPLCRVTSAIYAVSNFFRDKKPPEYFLRDGAEYEKQGAESYEQKPFKQRKNNKRGKRRRRGKSDKFKSGKFQSDNPRPSDVIQGG